MSDIENKIVEVCVYSDRAIVTRSVEIDSGTGLMEYLFKNLPEKVINDSVRVKVFGDAILIDNDLIESYLEETSSEKLNKLNEEITLLAFQIEDIKRKKNMNLAIKTALETAISAKVIDFPQDMKFELSLPNAYENSLDIFTGEMNTINKDLTGLQKQIDECTIKYSKLNKEKESISHSASKTVYLCKVNFDKKSAESCNLNLVYAITGASWAPQYDARLDYEKRKFELTRYADVKQMTGEEWNDITLSLSTANPVIGAYLGEPTPWYLDIFIPPPPPKPRMRTSGLKKAKAFAKEDKKEKRDMSDIPLPEAAAEMEADLCLSNAEKELIPPLAQETFADTAVKSTGVNVTFTCNANQDIPTDGTGKKVFISSDDFPVKYEYIIMPGIREAAYLKIIVTNTLDYSILKGPVKVFRDYDFVGDSNIKTIASGQDFEIYMGVDDNFKVKRELVNKFTAKKGFKGKDEKVEYQYKLVIESYKDNEEQVKVFEQIPVSRNKEIEVEIEKAGGFEFDNEDKGILKLEFTIKPKEKREIFYSYSVRYPSENLIFGLD